jgi:hypothetical protein
MDLSFTFFVVLYLFFLLHISADIKNVDINIVQNNNIILMKTFLIIFVVLMYLSTIALASEICHGEYFWYRVFAIWPFTIALVRIIAIIRKYKKPVEIEL